MTLPIYLAMTAEEMNGCTSLPLNTAYMACHFSPYGTGLTNLPHRLPKGSLLTVNDRIPVSGHDPQLITKQLSSLIERVEPAGILLDLQRSNCPQTLAIAQAITEHLPLPVAVSEPYAKVLHCPVFLSMPPLHVSLQEHAKPWTGREIWLDASLQACKFYITEAGSSQETCQQPKTELPLQDTNLHCHYRIHTGTDSVIFTLQRTRADLQALLEDGKIINMTKAVGLYQELGT